MIFCETWYIIRLCFDDIHAAGVISYSGSTFVEDAPPTKRDNPRGCPFLFMGTGLEGEAEVNDSLNGCQSSGRPSAQSHRRILLL